MSRGQFKRQLEQALKLHDEVLDNQLAQFRADNPNLTQAEIDAAIAHVDILKRAAREIGEEKYKELMKRKTGTPAKELPPTSH